MIKVKEMKISKYKRFFVQNAKFFNKPNQNMSEFSIGFSHLIDLVVI